MPKFIDHHRGLNLTQENISQSRAMIQSGTATEGGVKAFNGFSSADGKEAWCYVEAPNAAAVRQLHEHFYGLKGEEVQVTEVQSLV
ncbi:MAG: hypothetical protein HYX93_01190 [Chloroflexi bacterium]|nr:hypothetical protein [Chloroflexota bacterium]